MAKKQKAKSARQTNREQGRSRRRSMGAPVMFGIVALIAAGAAAFYLFGTPGESDSPGEVAADGTRVIEGSVHTVRHSEAPLPTADEPRADGLPTLVWFSGTWCHFCQAMSPFAHDTADEFASQVAFVEKSVDHDRSAANGYGVRGTPTFVLIDAYGEEIVRFGFQQTADAFRQVISDALDLT
jgi:thiol-disulfide isomerase/thioredoxin